MAQSEGVGITAEEQAAATLAEISRGIGHLAAAQRAILKGFPMTDREVTVPLGSAKEALTGL